MVDADVRTPRRAGCNAARVAETPPGATARASAPAPPKHGALQVVARSGLHAGAHGHGPGPCTGALQSAPQGGDKQRTMGTQARGRGAYGGGDGGRSSAWLSWLAAAVLYLSLSRSPSVSIFPIEGILETFGCTTRCIVGS